MKKLFFAVFAAFLLSLLSSCGISDEMQQRMNNSLVISLDTAFLDQDDFEAFAPTVEIFNLEKGESPWSPSDGYHGNFSCSFTDNGKSVYMNGSVGFDKNGQVAKGYDGRYAIDVSVILVDSKNVPVLQSPYNLSVFGGIVDE